MSNRYNRSSDPFDTQGEETQDWLRAVHGHNDPPSRTRRGAGLGAVTGFQTTNSPSWGDPYHDQGSQFQSNGNTYQYPAASSAYGDPRINPLGHAHTWDSSAGRDDHRAPADPTTFNQGSTQQSQGRSGGSRDRPKRSNTGGVGKSRSATKKSNSHQTTRTMQQGLNRIDDPQSQPHDQAMDDLSAQFQNFGTSGRAPTPERGPFGEQFTLAKRREKDVHGIDLKNREARRRHAGRLLDDDRLAPPSPPTVEKPLQIIPPSSPTPSQPSEDHLLSHSQQLEDSPDPLFSYSDTASSRQGRLQKRSPVPATSPAASVVNLSAPGKRTGSPVVTVSGKRTASSSRSRSRASSLTSGGVGNKSPPKVIESAEHLVADIQLSKTRLVIRKNFTIFNNPLVPFPSALLGLNITLHSPPTSGSRVKDCQIDLVFKSAEGPAPIIKAMAPNSPNGMTSLGAPLTVTSDKNLTGSIQIGYQSTAQATLTGTMGTNIVRQTSSARMVVSGIETHRALITVDEDSGAKDGVPPSFDFAVLLQLAPAQEGDPGIVAIGADGKPVKIKARPFEMELSVEASLAKGAVQESIARFLGSPREWVLGYDGETEIGILKLEAAVAGIIGPSTGQVIIPI
ncbi:hypothetical protein T439DRAFT_351182 [Meredithblackwellia eburnea MCA 4105]